MMTDCPESEAHEKRRLMGKEHHDKATNSAAEDNSKTHILGRVQLCVAAVSNM